MKKIAVYFCLLINFFAAHANCDNRLSQKPSQIKVKFLKKILLPKTNVDTRYLISFKRENIYCEIWLSTEQISLFQSNSIKANTEMTMREVYWRDEASWTHKTEKGEIYTLSCFHPNSINQINSIFSDLFRIQEQ